jgi:HlyD family secretion protein
MESFEPSFTGSKQKKKQQKRIRTLILIGSAVVVITIATILILTLSKKGESDTSTLTYRVGSVSSGEISTTISGSGTLSALEAETVTTTAESTVTAVNAKPGDAVKAGDVVLTMSSSEVESQLDELKDDLASTRSSLASAKQLLTNLKVTSSKAGIVKDIQAKVGSVVDDMAYLCRIATDGKMQLSIPVTSSVGQYDAVTVVVGEDQQEGYITQISGGMATVVFEDNYYPVGTSAQVLDANGNTLGTGTMDVNEYVDVTAASGKIATVVMEDNDKVGRGATIFTLAEGAPTATYTTLKKTETDLVSQIADLEDLLTVTADTDCTVTSLSVATGDKVDAGTTVCVLTGTNGFTLDLSIDELDIASVALDQSATVTLDALDGEFSGKVTNISYSGSGSYVTSYTATITTDPIEGAYPGMSASAEIVTATSGETLIVPVAAVQYDGDTAFVYLAGDDAQLGDTLADGALDLDKLTKITVTTGMSDGSYIAITADGIAAGDLVWVPERTSTKTYSEDESTATTFSMGGGNMMMGGDSSGFTPPSGDMGGQMPSGGMPSGN